MNAHGGPAAPCGCRARFGIVIDQSIHHAIGIFMEDALAFCAVDIAHSFVIAGLNTSERVLAVHDIRLAINHRTTIKPRGEQIACVHVTGCANFRGAVRRRIFISRQPSFARQCGRYAVRQRQFFLVSAAQKTPDHFETFVIEFQLLCQVGAVHKQVKMIRVGQRRTIWVAPAFSVEMQTKHKVGM